MKNHFIMPYKGGKRAEVEQIEKNIKLDNITTIVEPFCGTSAMSYYLSITYPKRFKYVLNDNNKLLIQLYNIMRNPELLQLFEDEINEICKTLDKPKYTELTKRRGKDDETLNSWFIANKVYKITPYLYKLDYV